MRTREFKKKVYSSLGVSPEGVLLPRLQLYK